MKKIALLAVAATALVAGPALAKDRMSGEQRLDRMLEGRVAGQPVSCISLSDSHDAQVIDGTAIVYGSGRTIYVNRPRDPRDLDRDDVMVTDIHGSQLCKLDAVRMHDRSGGFFRGFVSLEDFVPYRRVAARD